MQTMRNHSTLSLGIKFWYLCHDPIVNQTIDFTNYISYEQIVDYLHFLCKEKKCELLRLEETPEGRDILGVKIGPSFARTVVIESGIHAREWVTPMTALYTLTRISEDPQMVDNTQWIIIPLLNPDGYHYSWTNDKNRLWRKSRCKLYTGDCFGVDINRNFEFHWGCVKEDEGDVLGKPCSEEYRGTEPWSEPESRAIKQLINQLGSQGVLYISLHNYLQSIMYPWGYTKEPPEDEEDLAKVATDAQTAIKSKFGTKYRVGQASHIDRLTPGCSIDWVKGVGKIKYCYCIELPCPIYKFQTPPNSILKIASECFEGIKTLCEVIRKE